MGWNVKLEMWYGRERREEEEGEKKKKERREETAGQKMGTGWQEIGKKLARWKGRPVGRQGASAKAVERAQNSK